MHTVPERRTAEVNQRCWAFLLAAQDVIRLQVAMDDF